MQHAVFNLFWQGEFRPVLLQHGQTMALDTGHNIVCGKWGRSVVELRYLDRIITMIRNTCWGAGCSADGCKGSSVYRARWTCPVNQLNADTREVGGILVMTPAWVEAEAYHTNRFARSA